MAVGGDKKVEEKATDVATKSVALINENAFKLTVQDEEAISKVNIIADVHGVDWNEWFWVEGIPGLPPNATGSIGINLHSGVFWDHIANQLPEFWAPVIAHEGQHRMDFHNKTGGHDPGFVGTAEERRVFDERRALIRQLLIYRRMNENVPIKSSSYVPGLIHLIINPHKRV